MDHVSRRTFLERMAWSLTLPFSMGMMPRIAAGRSATAPPPAMNYHLTARPWTPIELDRQRILEVIEGLCRFSARHQAEDGAIVDPFLNREHQYATPYFAHAVGTLIHAGQADDLVQHGVLAMDHATGAVAGGNRSIPDQHGEFFIAPLTSALSLYRTVVEEDTMQRWRERLSAPITHIIEGMERKTNNWRTYAMKGEWLRANNGLVSPDEARRFVEDAWLVRTQRERIELDRWHLYQDWNGHPQSHAVEAVGRGNLLALVEAGYDGPSAARIEQLVLEGTATSLLLQDPTGQCPPNGRTDNHIFNDVLYQLIFDVMAERLMEEGSSYEAGQYRRAANLAFESILRWRRTDAPWEGSFFITKNHFDPDERIGYQPASQYSNYSGAVMYHLSEAYHTRRTGIREQPAPCEIGGYAFATDERFGSMVANAGGLHVFANLRGDSVPKYDTFWTPLGVVRFSRPDWESRLGPSDGARDALFEEAVSFGPTWQVGSRWVRLAMAAEHYQGTLRVDFVHPLLVKFSILYAPVTGIGGPNFFHDFTVTPDGVLSTVRSPHSFNFGVTLPLLEDDGRSLTVRVTDRIASTSYPSELGRGDEQHFIAVNEEPVVLEEGESVLSTYGWLRPVRLTTDAEEVAVFTYPRGQNDPPADEVASAFRRTETGFTSPLGRVEGALYVGRYAAGGVGTSLGLHEDGAEDISFDVPCGFFLTHSEGRIRSIETDRAVLARVGAREIEMRPFIPVDIESGKQ